MLVHLNKPILSPQFLFDWDGTPSSPLHPWKWLSQIIWMIDTHLLIYYDFINILSHNVTRHDHRKNFSSIQALIKYCLSKPTISMEMHHTLFNVGISSFFFPFSWVFYVDISSLALALISIEDNIVKSWLDHLLHIGLCTNHVGSSCRA